MQKYVLDAELRFKTDLEKGIARNWQSIMGENTLIIAENRQGGFQRVDNGLPLQLTAGIVVIHRPNQEQLNALALGAKSGQLFVLIVSGSPDDTFDLRADWLYSVRTPLNNRDDPAFTKRFELFLDDLEKASERKPNFSLLEPTAVPEALLSYALAVQYRLEVPNLLELCAAADASYKKLQPYAKSLFDKNRAVSFPGVDVPETHKFEPAIGDANGIRFKAMRNVIDLLREDL